MLISYARLLQLEDFFTSVFQELTDCKTGRADEG